MFYCRIGAKGSKEELVPATRAAIAFPATTATSVVPPPVPPVPPTTPATFPEALLLLIQVHLPLQIYQLVVHPSRCPRSKGRWQSQHGRSDGFLKRQILWQGSDSLGLWKAEA